MKRSLDGSTLAGFSAMNRALKNRVETVGWAAVGLHSDLVPDVR